MSERETEYIADAADPLLERSDPPSDIFARGEDHLPKTGEESPMDELRKQREELLQKRDCYIDIPGYKGKLVARYRLLLGDELEKIGEKVRRQATSQSDTLVLGSADTIIAGCEGLYVRVDRPEGEVMKPLELPPNSGNIAKFDERLAEYLDFGDEAHSAREVVMGLFGQNEMMLVQHQTRYARWMADPTRDPNERLLGE